MVSSKVLVVEDDPASGRLLQAILTPEGCDVSHADNGRAGLELMKSLRPDVMILDLRLPELDGITVLTQARAFAPDLPVIILTAFGDIRTAVAATKLGAFDYLTKPVDHEQLTFVVKRALEVRGLRAEVADLRRSAGLAPSLAVTMGPSPPIEKVIQQVETVAATSFSVLILGETGSGKELVAQAIHRQSERRGKPFVAIDCGAIPEALIESELFGHERGAFTGAERRRHGKFRIADGGTLFLDEIGNLPLALQAKLLRVLESKQLHSIGSASPSPFDVRFVAATNQDLQALASAGRFRADLYFRLAQYSIELPPLRERSGDIVYLAERCLEEASVELRRPMLKITRDALALLQRYEWPGNVRELRNVVRQAVLEADGVTLTRSKLSRLLKARDESVAWKELEREASPRSLRELALAAARDAERRAICDALMRTKGNKSRASKLLCTDYKTLYLKMKSLGIASRDFAV